MRIQTLVNDLGASKAGIARKLGLPQPYVYMWLEPQKYPRTLTDEALRKIAEFEGRSFRATKADYLSRLNRETAAA